MFFIKRTLADLDMFQDHVEVEFVLVLRNLCFRLWKSVF